jgi:protoheme IX farnesyltransferase
VTTPVLAVRRCALADFAELTKPRITLLVMLTALVGFVTASPGPLPLGALAATLLGTGLVAAGASALNMLLERHTDSLMRRTRSRPLPAGRLRPGEALAFGLLLTGAGLIVLAGCAGPLPALVALVSWGSYLFLYTPLKARTSLSTIIGAFPGALPPVIGWSAARGSLDPGAYVLFAIVFLWQIPHFLAIAWIYRDDYALGRLPMLPVLDPAGRMTGRQAVANSLALLLVSLAPTAAGMAGRVYLAGAILLGVALSAAAVRAALARTPGAARGLFLASILYLPALCALLLMERVHKFG